MNYLRPVIGRVNLTNCVHSYAKPPRTLITGGLGQLGTALATRLREKYGRDSVILTDVKKPSHKVYSEGPYAYINILNYYEIESMVVNEGIDWIVNYSALLSAAAEANVSVAMDINMKGFENVLNVAKAHDLRVFCPSTIGAFGPTSPRKKTPDLTIQRPKTVYGVTKVYMELLGEYYHHRYGTDFRSARYPGVISALTMPGGGTTDYSVHIFHEALRTGYYECFLRADSPDCSLSMRTYNCNALSFTPEELTKELTKYVTHLKVDYIPDHRQAIADSWPETLDDVSARRDWGWSPKYDLAKMVKTVFDILNSSHM